MVLKACQQLPKESEPGENGQEEVQVVVPPVDEAISRKVGFGIKYLQSI